MKLLRKYSYLLLCFSCAFLADTAEAKPRLTGDLPTQNDGFSVGAAAAKITPPVGSIMGNSYGITVSEGVHDDLYAKTLVFDHAGVRAAFIALDLISIPHEIVVKTRELISRQSGISPDRVIMSATHLHAGPQLNPLFWKAVGGAPQEKSERYAETLPSIIAGSVQAALDKLQPVRLSVGVVSEDEVNFNRRYLLNDGTFMMNPGRRDIVRAAGPIDPELSVVYIESLDSKPVAVLVNFALHVAVVGGDHFSSDFPGRVSRLLAEVKGDEMVTVFTNGTSGNVNNVDRTHRDQPRGQAEAARIGTILAGDVLKALRSLKPVEATSLQVRTETVELPVPRVDRDQTEWAKDILSRFGQPKSPPFSDIVSAWRIMDLAEVKGGDRARHAQTTTVPLVEGGGALKSEIQIMTIGDQLALVGFPGDAFVELGLDIKLHSPFPFTIVCEQSGNGTLSYVPNRKAFREKGYEVNSARFAPGGAELLVDAAIKNLIDVFPYKPETDTSSPVRKK